MITKMYFKINHKSQLDWKGNTTIFFIVLHEKDSAVGASTCVYTNANKQGTVSCQFSTIGHSTVNQITEFDLHLETGLTSLSPSMSLIGEAALRSHLDANELHPLTHGPLYEILSHSIESDRLNNLSPAQLSP